MIWHTKVIFLLKASNLFQTVQLQGGKVRGTIDSTRFLDIHYDPLSGSYSYALIDQSLPDKGDKRLLGWDDFPHPGNATLQKLVSYPHHYQKRTPEGQWHFEPSAFYGNIEVEIPIVIDVIRQLVALSSTNYASKTLNGKERANYSQEPYRSNNLGGFSRSIESYEQINQITSISKDLLDRLLADIYGGRLRIHDLLERAGMQPTQIVAVLQDHGNEITHIILEMFHEFLLARSGGERLWYLINERYGLSGEKPKTLESIGEEMGITRERVRQLQNSALAKLRLPQRRKRLIECLGDKVTEWNRLTTIQPVSQSFGSSIPPGLPTNFITVDQRNYSRAYEPWASEEEQRLVELSRRGLTHDEIARQLQRQPGAIRSRLRKLGIMK